MNFTNLGPVRSRPLAASKATAPARRAWHRPGEVPATVIPRPRERNRNGTIVSVIVHGLLFVPLPAVCRAAHRSCNSANLAPGFWTSRWRRRREQRDGQHPLCAPHSGAPCRRWRRRSLRSCRAAEAAGGAGASAVEMPKVAMKNQGRCECSDALGRRRVGKRRYQGERTGLRWRDRIRIGTATVGRRTRHRRGGNTGIHPPYQQPELFLPPIPFPSGVRGTEIL